MNVRAMRVFVFLAAGAAAMANEGDLDSNLLGRLGGFFGRLGAALSRFGILLGAYWAILGRF